MALTVLKKGNPIVKEAVASEAITPGHLVEFGGTNDVQKHSTASGNARKAFMREQDYIGQDIDTACAAGDRIPYFVGRTGDEVRGLVAAGAAAIAKGDPLESAGDGTVKLHSPPSDAAGTTIKHDAIVGYAMEAVDNSGGSEAVRIAIEVA